MGNGREESESRSTGFNSQNRRSFLATVGSLTAVAAAGSSLAQEAPVRYPDPRITALDSRFEKYRIGNTPITTIYRGTLWAEGPAWNPVGKYLVFSDIPNNEQLRWIEEDGHVSRQFRFPSGHSNGNTFDFEGRQISCLHGPRQVVRYEYAGGFTVLSDSFDGKSFNAPNDVVVHPEDLSIWFTDPGYGSLSNYEGYKAGTGSPQPFQKESVYRIDGQTGEVTRVADAPYKPNGLCFSPDLKKLYVADTGASHYPEAKPIIWQFDVVGKGLSNPRTFVSMEYEGNSGMADGIACDIDGNVWASAGWVGEGYDGVHVFAPDGDRIGMIQLPEICSNVCFGGSRANRLFMTASQSVYSVFVATRGAHILGT